MRYLGLAGLIAAVALGWAGTARACAFHGYVPNPTLVDQLLATEQVALARPSGGRYVDARALLGAPPVLDMPVSAPLRGAPAVLLARDGAYGPWLELAAVDSRFQRLIAEVLARQSAWQLGRDTDRPRLFAAHLNDPSPQIRRLALQEMDRTDYATLRRLRLPPLPDVLDTLSAEPDLIPIRLLLAGLSGETRWRAPLADALTRAVQTDVAYLGAYATALIELSPQEGLAQVLRHAADPALPLARRDKLIEALALHYKTGAPGLRRKIAAETAALVRADPALRRAAAQFFGTARF